MVRSNKSQNHRKYSKIVENQVFWTVCELLAYCEVVGMLLVPNYVKIKVFVYFQTDFCVFTPLFESKNESEMVKMRQTAMAKWPPRRSRNRKIQLKTDYHIPGHYTIVLHVSDTFSDYYRCFYDVLKRFLCFYITF